MNVRDLIPWGRQESRLPVVTRESRETPWLSLQREMNRVFDDAFRGWDLPMISRGGQWPSVELSERDDEIRVLAEVPGLTERDIDLSIEEGMLTIRGERKGETRDEERGYSECFYGKFERRVALPSDVEVDKANARFDNGLLTVTLPKVPGTERRRRIPINRETTH